jgi:hypothetical protein
VRAKDARRLQEESSSHAIKIDGFREWFANPRYQGIACMLRTGHVQYLEEISQLKSLFAIIHQKLTNLNPKFKQKRISLRKPVQTTIYKYLMGSTKPKVYVKILLLNLLVASDTCT